MNDAAEADVRTLVPPHGRAAGQPDAAEIVAIDWPRRPLGEIAAGERADGFQVVLRSDAADAIRAHGKTTTQVEVGGVLVGNVYHDHHGPYLLIHAAIAADCTRSDAAHVTFTSATWAHIHQQMDAKYPDDRIVGWYHTHPDFGVFLSEMDLFIQSNFFDEPWQVALVYDPVRNDEGTFVWRRGKTTREPILIEQFHASAESAAAVAAHASDKTPSGTWFWFVFLALVGALLFALGVLEWLGYSNSEVNRWIEQSWNP